MGPTHLRELPQVLLRMLRDPLGTVRRPLDFSWPLVLNILGVSAFASGAIAGAITHSIGDFLVGILIFPITSVITATVFGFFIYYFFSLFRSTFLDFRRLMSLVSVAVVPYFLFHSVSSYVPPIDLLGFAFTCVLLIVGLVEQFGLDRRLCSKLVGVLGLVFFVVWIAAQIRNTGAL